MGKEWNDFCGDLFLLLAGCLCVHPSFETVTRTVAWWSLCYLKVCMRIREGLLEKKKKKDTLEDDSENVPSETIEEVVEEKIAPEPESVDAEAVEEEIITTTAAALLPVVTRGAIVDVTNIEEITTAAVENVAETTTALAV